MNKKEKTTSFNIREWVKTQIGRGDIDVVKIIQHVFPNEEFWDENDFSFNEKFNLLNDAVIVFYRVYYHENNKDKLQDSYPRIGDRQCKTDLCLAAMKYIQTPWLHCKTFTCDIIKALLDLEIYPLQEELTETGQIKHDFKKMKKVLIRSGLLGYFHSLILTVCPFWLFSVYCVIRSLFRLFLWLLCILFAFSNAYVISIILGGWLIRGIYKNSKFDERMKVFLQDQVSRCMDYTNIREEIVSKIFSPIRMKERLIDIEKKGACVHSVVYELLSMIDIRV